jgi:hypothetical protein
MIGSGSRAGNAAESCSAATGGRDAWLSDGNADSGVSAEPIGPDG